MKKNLQEILVPITAANAVKNVSKNTVPAADCGICQLVLEKSAPKMATRRMVTGRTRCAVRNASE